MSKYDELNTVSKVEVNDSAAGIASSDLEDYLSDDAADMPSSETWVTRFFSPVKAGSLRGNTIAVASITFGIGCLQFPKAMVDIGLIPAICLFLGTGILTYWSLYILLLTARKRRLLSYDGIIKVCLGNGMAIFSDITNLILLFGVLLAFEKTISDTALVLLNIFFEIEPTQKIKLIQMAVCMVPQILISLLKDVSKLQYAGMVSACTIIYTTIVTIVEMPFYWHEGKHQGRTFELFEPFNWNFLFSFSTLLFAYASHNGIFSVIKDLRKPTKRRMMKVLNRALILEFILFGIIAFAGFFCILEDTPGIFINRKPLDYFGDRDYYIIVSQILFILCLTCTMSIIYNIIRGSFKTLIFRRDHINIWVDTILMIFVYVLTNTLTFFIKDLLDVVSILGGFCGVNICYIFPILCYMKSNDYPRWHWKNIGSFLIMIIITGMGYSITIYNVVIKFK